MKKQQVLEALCELSAKVMDKEFNFQVPADCFCGKNQHQDDITFAFDSEIIDFITDAVNEKLKRDVDIDEIYNNLAGNLLKNELSLVSLIRIYRKITGCGLKDSKIMVENAILDCAERIKFYRSIA